MSPSHHYNAYGNNGSSLSGYGGYVLNSNSSRYEDEIYNAFYPVSSSIVNNNAQVGFFIVFNHF